MKLQKRWMLVLVFLAGVSVIVASKPAGAVAQEAGARVSGRLWNVEGAPFNDRNTRAVLRVGNGVAAVSNIGFDGDFEFSNISPGNYSLSLTGLGAALSPVFPVRVANTDIQNIEMIVPRAKEVSGQVTLDGDGPLPEVRLLLKPVKDPTMDPAVKALSPSGFVTNDAFAGLVPITPMVNLNPRPDGTLVVRIPDGDWNVSVYGELPTGYAIQSLTYGTADILHGPLKVRLSEDAAVRLSLTNSSVQLSKVYGRITGLTPAMIAREPMSVSLNGPMSRTGPGAVRLQDRKGAVRADGTFEIDDVLPGEYSVMVTGLDTLNLAVARLSVTKSDIQNFEIEILRTEVRGQIVVEGGPVPAMTLMFKKVQERGAVVGGDEFLTVAVRPLPDGTFSALFPEEEQLVNTGYGGPCGYKLKSMIYGATDALRIPLRVLKSNTSQLQITLTYSECLKR